jgi:hypothetical protein
MQAANGNGASKGRKGFFVLFGAPGTWKSSQALWTFQDSLYLASSEGLDQFYMHVQLKTPEAQALNKKPPKKIVILDQYSINGGPLTFGPNGEMVKTPQCATMEQAIEDVTKVLNNDKIAGRPPTFRNIIIDEASVFWDRFFIEIAADCIRNGNRDGRAHHQAIQVWTRQVIDRFRTVLSMGANLIAIAHDVEPDGKSRKGGAQMPNARTSKIFGADSHLSMLSDFEEVSGLDFNTNVKGPPKHLWRGFASSSMNSKIRGISAERFEEIKYWSLEKIVLEAGFEP